MSGAEAESGRAKRKDMLETIEHQEKVIAKYEARLKDVVRAYKGLAKEKEALEQSLKVISESGEAAEAGSRPNPPEGVADVGETSPGDSDAMSSVSQESELDTKIRTLTGSLAAMTKERSRLETAFQEDRKKLMGEKKELTKEVEALRKDVEAVRVKAKADLDEAKSKLIIERHEREKETSDHAVMLRELQKLLADERRAKEKLESALAEARNKEKAVVKAAEGSKVESRKMRDLEMKLRLTTEEADKAKKTLEKVQPELEKFSKELKDTKIFYQREMEKTERKAEAAELRASRIRVEQEQRVNTLESRLQELSETVGTYDRLRQHDQAEIAKLRDQLGDRGSRSNSSSQDHRDPQDTTGQSLASESDDVQVLLERFFKLKASLKEKNAASDSPVDLDSLIGDSDEAKAWKDKHDRLKKEFETLKSKRESVQVRSANRYLLSEADQEVILNLKSQVAELEDRVETLRRQLTASGQEKMELETSLQDLEEVVAITKKKAKEDLDQKENEFRAKILSLESELQKQRDRCLTLIEEKEDEVNMLKSNMELAFETAFSSPDGRESKLRMAAASMASASTPSGRKKSVASREDSLTDGMKSSEGMVLHYVQELSHKDVELASLRQRVFELESTMREVQMTAVAKEEKYSEEIEALQEQMARVQRMSSKEGANLEYLKNVVLSYMLSSSPSSRDHMLKAIGAVLLFSKADVKRVRDHNASWWPH